MINFNCGDTNTRRGRIARLANLLELLSMKKHVFSPKDEVFGPKQHIVKKGEIRKFIEEQSRLWRETWILPELRNLLTYEESKGKKKT